MTLLKNTLLFTFSILLCFLMGELGLRLIIPERLSNEPHLNNGDYTYQPNQSEQFTHIEWDYRININADGFRNKKALADIKPGSILLIGDSFTEGYGVDENDTFAAQLNRLMKKNGVNADVYNAGQSDSGIVHYLAKYRHFFAKNDKIKTIVVGLMVANDLINNMPVDIMEEGRIGTPMHVGNSFKYKIKIFLAENSIVYNSLIFAVKSNEILHHYCQSFGLCTKEHISDIYFPDRIRPYIEPTVNFLKQFSKEVEADGKRFVVMIIPARMQISDMHWAQFHKNGRQPAPANKKINRLYVTDSLEQSLALANIETLNLTSTMHLYQKQNKDRNLYFKWDGHWTATGHKVAGELLYKKLFP